MKLEAPYPAIEMTTILPNPDLSDVERPDMEINIKRFLDGSRRTYVRNADVHNFTYTFNLSRMKTLELKAFVERYFDSKIRLTNHKDEIWIVTIVDNPFEAAAVSRAIASPGDEDATVTINFEGKSNG